MQTLVRVKRDRPTMNSVARTRAKRYRIQLASLDRLETLSSSQRTEADFQASINIDAEEVLRAKYARHDSGTRITQLESAIVLSIEPIDFPQRIDSRTSLPKCFGKFWEDPEVRTLLDRHVSASRTELSEK